MKIFFKRSTMTSSGSSSEVKRDGSETPEYSNPNFSRFINGWIRLFMKEKATLSAVSPCRYSSLTRAMMVGICRHSSVGGSAFHWSL